VTFSNAQSTVKFERQTRTKLTDQIKEKIRFNTEILRLFCVFLLAVGGGVIALIIGEVDSGRKVVFIASGMIVTFVCIVGIYAMYTRTRKLLRNT